jgi:hypothetical protein
MRGLPVSVQLLRDAVPLPLALASALHCRVLIRIIRKIEEIRD